MRVSNRIMPPSEKRGSTRGGQGQFGRLVLAIVDIQLELHGAVRAAVEAVAVLFQFSCCMLCICIIDCLFVDVLFVLLY